MNLKTNVESILKQEMMEHQSQALFLERNGETSAKEHTNIKEPSAKPQNTNINLIRSKLVQEISIHWYLERHITQSWYMNQVCIIAHVFKHEQ